jgi:hypothetical protein
MAARPLRKSQPARELAARLGGHRLGDPPAAVVVNEPGRRAHAAVVNRDAEIIQPPIPL